MILILVSTVANAQVGAHRNDFSVGVSGGYTLNKVSFNPSIKQKFKGAPEFGFAARYICEKYFTSICGVQLEVNYQNLGWTEDIEDIKTGTGEETVYTLKDNKYTRDLQCLEVPVMMQMGWGYERKGCKFIFEAGPYLQYFFSSKETYSGDPWDPSHRPNSVNYQYGMALDHKVAYGIKAGLGLEYSSPIGHFILHGRYCYGLGDMFDNSKKGKFGRSANGTIEVKLTYLFDIIKTKLDK